MRTSGSECVVRVCDFENTRFVQNLRHNIILYYDDIIILFITFFIGDI